ncbi:MAG: dihydrofolate reductase family protein [Propionibacteriales bacterium]|nr:dihydrofolate reductase family protein [Propionibacteriales bacterium]
MGRIIVSQNVSLDGVVQDPTGDDGFARGGWFSRMSDVDREAWAEVEYAEAVDADAMLLGRRTYDYFVTRGWSTQSGPWAGRLRSLPKYVVSSTLRDPEWANSTVLDGDALEEVSKLKANLGGEIVVYGSQQLMPILLEHDLVDEFRLTVHPFVVGAGERLFGQTPGSLALRLVTTQILGAGLSHLTYERVREA